MYAVVAPGIKGVYKYPRDIERILQTYPYARFQKFPTEEQCYKWITENSTSRKLEVIKDYGDAFPECSVVMSYFTFKGNLYVNCDTRNFGQMRIHVPDNLDIQLDQTPTMCCFKTPFTVQARPIQLNLLALTRALQIIGDDVDVIIRVPDHSIFYALRSYTGKDPIVHRAQDAVNKRVGGTSVSLGVTYGKSKTQAPICAPQETPPW